MDHLPALVVATAILVLIPGPNVALIVATSLRHGVRAGLVTVLGTTAGVALQLAIVAVGMAAIIGFAADALSVVRWAGVVYLVWLGIRTWREAPGTPAAVVPAPAMFSRGVLLAASNPKTLLFAAAFLPQFVPDRAGSAWQAALVAAVYLVVLCAGDLLWAAFAGRARSLIRRPGRWRNRLAGGFFVAAGIGLALSRRGPGVPA